MSIPALALNPASSANSAHPASSAAEPLAGHWGGDQAQLVFDGTVARLELGCASGTLIGPVRPDAEGRFVAHGTFEQHHGGPQHADAAAKAGKASYTGELKDGVLTLSILPEGTGTPALLHLRPGTRVKLVRCY